MVILFIQTPFFHEDCFVEVDADVLETLKKKIKIVKTNYI